MIFKALRNRILTGIVVMATAVTCYFPSFPVFASTSVISFNSLLQNDTGTIMIDGVKCTNLGEMFRVMSDKECVSWQFPDAIVSTGNRLTSVTIQFSSPIYDQRNRVDATGVDQSLVSVKGGDYTVTLESRDLRPLSDEYWEKLIGQVKITTYDKLTRTEDGGVTSNCTLTLIGSAISLGDGFVYDSTTGHFYQYIDVGYPIDWHTARQRALNSYLELNASYGYLATITSQQENDLIVAGMPSALGWIGAMRTSIWTHEWYWVDGPEAGTEFWYTYPIGYSAGSYLENGYPLNGQYNNWSRGTPKEDGSIYYEPNNDTRETVAHLICSGYRGWSKENHGEWNDYSPFNEAVTSYIIEYGDEDSKLQENGEVALEVTNIGILNDNLAPEVTVDWSRKPMTSDTLIVTATDDSGVIAGYCITETPTPPALDDPAWRSSGTFTRLAVSNRVYYCWAKDEAGNVGGCTADVKTLDLYAPIITDIILK